MVANLITGRLSDSIGNRKVIVALLVMLALVLAWLPFASANLWTTAIAVAIWGAVAWGLLAPQQHRLVAVAPHSAPVVLGLNTSGSYLGFTAAGIVGALALPVVGAHNLGYIGAAFTVVALGIAELATLKINSANGTDQYSRGEMKHAADKHRSDGLQLEPGADVVLGQGEHIRVERGNSSFSVSRMARPVLPAVSHCAASTTPMRRHDRFASTRQIQSLTTNVRCDGTVPCDHHSTNVRHLPAIVRSRRSASSQ